MKLVKKFSLSIMLLLSSMLWSASSHANFFFWEFNVGTGTFSPDVGTEEDITVLSGSFGGFLTQIISYEIQVAAGWEDQDSFNGSGSAQVSHGAGLIGFNIGSRDANISLMGGVGAFSIDTAVNDISEEGVAIAFAVNLYANEKSGLTFEIFNIEDDDDNEYGIVSLGYKRKF